MATSAKIAAPSAYVSPQSSRRGSQIAGYERWRPMSARVAHCRTERPAWTPPRTAERREFLRRGSGANASQLRGNLSHTSSTRSIEPKVEAPETGPDGWPRPDRDKWIAGRWVEPWCKEQGDLRAEPHVGGAACAAQEGIKYEQYARFYRATTGTEPPARLKTSYEAAVGLRPSNLNCPARPQLGCPTVEMASSQLLEEQRRAGAWWEQSDRYFEPKPRPPRDPSGMVPRTGVGHHAFANALRLYDLNNRPRYKRSAGPRGAHELLEQTLSLNRSRFTRNHVGPPPGFDARSIADFGSWVDTGGGASEEKLASSNTVFQRRAGH
jgi:hypothetical protein